MKTLRLLSLLALVTLLGAAVPAAASNAAQTAAYEIWITNQTKDRIEIYAGATYELLATVPVDADGVDATSRPHMILFSPNNRHAYVTNVGAAPGTNNLVVVDTATRQIVGTYAAGPSAHAAVPSPDGQRVWVTNIGGNNLTEYMVGPGGQLTPGRTLSAFGVRPICLAFTRDSRFAYLTNGGSPTALGSVVVLGVSDGQPVVNAPIGREGCGTVLSRDGSKMYVSAGFHTANEPQLNDEWWVFDAQTHTVTAQGRGPGTDVHGLMENPAGTQLWMVARRTNEVNVFDAGTHQWLATYPAGDRPDLLAFSPDGSLVFISRRGNAVTGDAHSLTGKDPGFVVMRTSDGAILGWVSTGTDDIHGINVLPR